MLGPPHENGRTSHCTIRTCAAGGVNSICLHMHQIWQRSQFYSFVLCIALAPTRTLYDVCAADAICRAAGCKRRQERRYLNRNVLRKLGVEKSRCCPLILTGVCRAQLFANRLRLISLSLWRLQQHCFHSSLLRLAGVVCLCT